MAEKQASVYIVDVGSSMGLKQNGRDETDLEFAMKWVWDKITSTVMTERKTDTVGVLGLRTDDTDNELGDDPAYQCISVIEPIQQFLMPQLRSVREQIVPSHTEGGDGISALVIAIQMIVKYCKKLKYIRNIFLVTNGRGSYDPDGLDEIIKQIVSEGIKLTVLGVDFDDEEFGFKEEDKPEEKAVNEFLLRDVCEKCDGVFGTLAEAITELSRPRLKKVRPVPSYRGTLSLGDYINDDSAFCIDVERYPRTMLAKPISASSFVQKAKPEDEEGSSLTMAASPGDGKGEGMTSVRMQRAYIVKDEDAPGGMKEVDREELEKGYMYGRAVVPISSTDEGITTLNTDASFEILGFIPRTGYERYFSMSTTCVVVGQRTNPKSIMALSSLIHALYELDHYIVARLVTKKDKPPVMVVMAPLIEPEFEALIDVQVPFVEDIRQYRFPPLDTVKTITGKALTEHRNLPTAELNDAMSKYIDQMNLSEFGVDDEGNKTDYVPPEDTFSPVLHRIDQVVRFRGIHPDDPLPPVNDILLKYSHPPEDLIERSKNAIKALVDAANVKKVPPKVRGKRQREQPKPMSGLDVNELLRSSGDSSPNKRIKLSSINPIPEFKQAMSEATDMETIKDLCSQFAGIIKETVNDSFADMNYGKAIEMVGVIRSELIDVDEPEQYNEFVKDFKKAILSGDLGGDRRDMWKEVRKNKLGLITGNDNDRLKITEAEEKKFLNDF
ncbi:putative Ku family DNA helicase [Peziza echinospora]|nr:putative Ku family DNA helicase [Peziza echinospora]